MSEKVYAGMDLGQRFHQVAVVGKNMKALVAPFQVGRGREGIQEIFERLRFLKRDPQELVFTVEATGNYWNELVWDLSGRGCEVYLAHPKKSHDLRRFYALHTKTDITDAEALARMPLVDEQLIPVWVPQREQQVLLRLCRLRWKYRCRIADVKRRTSRFADTVMPGIGEVMPLRYSKSARLFLRRYLAVAKPKRLGKKRLRQIMTKAAWGKFSDERMEQLWDCIQNAPDLGLLPDDVLLEVEVQLDELNMLEQQTARLDGRIAELYAEVDPQHTLLQIPGAGEFLAAALTAAIGDVRRFPSGKYLISYAGLAPRVKSSAGTTKAGQGITKHGSPFLRAWAYLAANTARQYDPDLKAYYVHLRRRRKHHNVALCATAARLLERCHEMLSEEVPSERESSGQIPCTG
jgi:transposase